MHNKLMPVIALSCYVLAFNTNRPNYDMIDKSNSTSIHKAIANSYINELKFKEKHKLESVKLSSSKLTIEQIDNIIADVKKKEIEEQYKKDWYLMASLVDAECGSSWLSDEQQMLTVCVLKNRISSPLFPNTLHDVIYQKNPKQYESAWNGSLNRTPSERALKNVKTVLDGKFTCPDKVLYQCEHIEGKIYKQFYNKYSGTTTYFCYSNK